MNHLITINTKKYIVRQYSQKIALLSFPEFYVVSKYYANVQFTAINRNTTEILSIYNKTITILQPALMPLQLIQKQQCFLEWQPSGGIIMKNNIILYDLHSIVFMVRGGLMQKSWEIDIIQDIDEIKTNDNESSLAMKIKNPNNTIFIWKMDDLNIKPNQEIILNEEILQWEFYSSQILSILTRTQFRIYKKNHLNEFNLLHFYDFFNYRSFCWVGDFTVSETAKQSVNTVLLLGRQGKSILVELYNIERRVSHSTFQQIAKLELVYKGIQMKRALAGWSFGQNSKLVCETKNHHVFCFDLGFINFKVQIVSSNTNQQLLGAQVKQVYFQDNIILAKDKTFWKYYRFINNNNFQLLKVIDCEKAFIVDETSYCYLKDQKMYINKFQQFQDKCLDIKYANVNLFSLLQNHKAGKYFLNGIRVLRVSSQNVILSTGFTIKNQKAKLIQVCSFTKSLIYSIGEQYCLMEYSVINDKVIAKIIKSSSCRCVSLFAGKWAELDNFQIRVGQGDKILTVFKLSKIYKILAVQEKNYDYNLYALCNNGLALILKNYVFFLQLVEDENGYEINFLKRLNTILYKRFNPQAQNFKLINPQQLVFWLDNSIIRLGYKINYHISEDPFGLPDTLIKKQIDMKKSYPLHSPKIIHSFIQSNKIGLVVAMLKNIYGWFKKPERHIGQFYDLIGIDFMYNYLQQHTVDDISNFNQIRLNEDCQFLQKFSAQLLQSSEDIILKDKNPLIFESQLQALKYAFQNSKNLDYFSQFTFIELKTPFLKGLPFETIHIAYLYHSLNKQQMISMIKPQKIDWGWIQNYSIILWYDNKENIRKWIQQIGMNQYRLKKDPFDCLFWYILAGKKSLLVNLFKNHKLDSKQHDSMFNFLQRDFSQAKDRTAAIKNAFVLIDKKRYFHALAFFILGDQLNDCVRISFDRLKDINLAYLFCLFFKNANSQYFLGQVYRKGDIWIKHIVKKIKAQHIDAYNCLFEDEPNQKWDLIPNLTGFHPSVIDFSQKILNSVAVKRQIQAQKAPKSISQDIFSDFYKQESISNQAVSTDQKQIKLIMSNPQKQKSQAIRYYLKQGLPLLAQLIDRTNPQAQIASELQNYKLTGNIKSSVEQTVLRLEDIIGIVNHYIKKKNFHELLHYLQQFKQNFIEAFKGIYFLEYIESKKYKIGQIIHYSYYSDKVIQSLKSSDLISDLTNEIQKFILDIKEVCLLGKIYVCISLDYFQPLPQFLNFSNKIYQIQISDKFWVLVKQKYDNLSEQRKQKQLKLMDHFQHAFIKVKKNEQGNNLRTDLKLDLCETAQILFKLLVFNYLANELKIFKLEIMRHQNSLQDCLKYWTDEVIYNDVLKQFKIAVLEGSKGSYKLNILKELFEDNLNSFLEIMSVCGPNFLPQPTKPLIGVNSKQIQVAELQGIQIFKNKQDGMKSFILNQIEGAGLQCVVMFKRVLKKFEICQNLGKRQRSNNGYLIVGDDLISNTKPSFDFNSLKDSKCCPLINDAIRHILQTKKILSTSDLIRNMAPFNQKEYSKILDPLPYLDYNQLNSIASHPYLPFYFIGGKSCVEVCHFSTMKNFNRINCAGMNDIVKIHPSSHRISVSDTSGSLLTYNFDKDYQNNCVFGLKKTGIIDFCHIRPSIIATISAQGINIYDTLLHPKRQLKFKQTFTKEPTSIIAVNDKMISVLRKNEVLLYDIRFERLQSSRDLKGKGKSMTSVGNKIYIGLTDSKVKVYDCSKEDYNQTIKISNYDERDRQKNSIDNLVAFKDIVIAQSSEGSLYYLPPLSL